MRLSYKKREHEVILFLTNSYPDFYGSFRGHFIKKLAINLGRKGLLPVIVTPRVFTKSASFQSEPGGIDVIRFHYPSGNRQLLSFKKIPYFRMIFFLISGLFSAIRISKEYKCKIIHAHWVIPTGFLGVLAGIILKTPVIVHARGTDMHDYASKSWLLREITYWTLKRADLIIVVSNEIKKIMKKQFYINESKIHVIPTGIDTKLFSPGKKPGGKMVYLDGKSKINLIYVGGLYKQKGIGTLLTAMKYLFKKSLKFSLTLVGDGPLREMITQWIKNNGFTSRIVLKGSIPHNRIPEILKQSDIFILPSLNEGTPNSLLEAMACGIPPIATKVGDIPAVIDHCSDGLLIDSHDSKMLALSVERLVKEPELYNRISVNARKKALGFSEQDSADRIIKLYTMMTG